MAGAFFERFFGNDLHEDEYRQVAEQMDGPSAFSLAIIWQTFGKFWQIKRP
jgi:hypothetical protein